MATIKYIILKKEQRLCCYREGYGVAFYKNLERDVKVVIEESLIRYTLQIVSIDSIMTITCDNFEIKEVGQ